MNGKFKFIFGLIELCLMASMPLFNNTKNPKQNLITINENIKKVGYFKLFITNLKNVLGAN